MPKEVDVRLCDGPCVPRAHSVDHRNDPKNASATPQRGATRWRDAEGGGGGGGTYGHVVAALGAVSIGHAGGLACLGHDAIQGIGHVGPDVVVPVLVEREGARRVLHEQMQDADAVLGDLGAEGRLDVRRHEIGPTRSRRQGEGRLEPATGRRGGGGGGRRRRGRHGPVRTRTRPRPRLGPEDGRLPHEIERQARRRDELGREEGQQ